MGEKQYSMGRIVDIRKEDQQYGYIVQGEEAKKWRDGFGCTGGNGTYRLWAGGGVNHCLFLDVSVYANQNHKSSIDIRDRALAANGRSRVTAGFIDALKAKNVGKKIHLVCGEDTSWQWAIANWNELDLTI